MSQELTSSRRELLLRVIPTCAICLGCHGDIAATKAYNPKIALNRPKILMNGDDECRFHWTLQV